MNKNYRMDNFVKGEAAFRVEKEDIEAFLKDCDGYNLRWRDGKKAFDYNPFIHTFNRDKGFVYIEMNDKGIAYTTDRSNVKPVIYGYKAHLKEINDKTYDFKKLLNEVSVIATRLHRAERAFHYIDDLDNAKNFDIVIHRNDSRNVDIDLSSGADSEYIKDTLKDIKRKELSHEAMEAIELICELARELDRVTGIDISSEGVDE